MFSFFFNLKILVLIKRMVIIFVSVLVMKIVLVCCTWYHFVVVFMAGEQQRIFAGIRARGTAAAKWHPHIEQRRTSHRWCLPASAASQSSSLTDWLTDWLSACTRREDRLKSQECISLPATICRGQYFNFRRLRGEPPAVCPPLVATFWQQLLFSVQSNVFLFWFARWRANPCRHLSIYGDFFCKSNRNFCV